MKTALRLRDIERQRLVFLLLGLATSLVSMLLVGACAGLPPERPLGRMKTGDDYAAAQSFAAPAVQWPGDAWWAAYKDPQLDALIGEALAGSPTLAVARARLERANADAPAANAAQLPQVSANASITGQKQSYNYITPPVVTPQGWNDYGRATLDFSWELDFWGKNRAALAAATSEADAARADAAQARIALATSVASAYAELARLHAALDTAKAARDVRAKTAELFAERFANGLETRGSVRQ